MKRSETFAVTKLKTLTVSRRAIRLACRWVPDLPCERSHALSSQDAIAGGQSIQRPLECQAKSPATAGFFWICLNAIRKPIRYCACEVCQFFCVNDAILFLGWGAGEGYRSGKLAK